MQLRVPFSPGEKGAEGRGRGWHTVKRNAGGLAEQAREMNISNEL